MVTTPRAEGKILLDLHARVRRLQWLTLVWMTVEASVGIALGVTRGSDALTGFGVDSAIELASAVSVLVLFSRGAQRTEDSLLARTRHLLIADVCLLIAVAFFRAAFFAKEAVESLRGHASDGCG